MEDIIVNWNYYYYYWKNYRIEILNFNYIKQEKLVESEIEFKYIYNKRNNKILLKIYKKLELIFISS